MFFSHRTYSHYQYFARRRGDNNTSPRDFHQRITRSISEFEDCITHHSPRSCVYTKVFLASDLYFFFNYQSKGSMKTLYLDTLTVFLKEYSKCILNFLPPIPEYAILNTSTRTIGFTCTCMSAPYYHALWAERCP